MKHPVAWAYEETEYADKAYEKGWRGRVSLEKPYDMTGSVRNVIALYAHDPDAISDEMVEAALTKYWFQDDWRKYPDVEFVKTSMRNALAAALQPSQ